MSRKAGVISIDLNAGTAKAVIDLEKVSGKLREIGSAGHGSVSGVQATSGALRVLEGNMTNNLRAAERFVANVLHMGPILQAAFPVVGLVAFGGLLGELGGKVYNFFKSAAEGPRKMAEAFREINNPLRVANDELALSNARLDVDIAKLEHKPQNNLAVALAEAKVAADKLGEALEKDLKSIDEVLKKNSVGFWKQTFAGKASTSDLEDMNERFRQSIGAVEDNEKISATEKRTRVTNLLSSALKELHEREGMASISIPSAIGSAVGVGGLSLEDSSARQNAIRAMRRNYQGELDRIGLEGANESKTVQKGKLEEGAESAKKYAEELKRLQEQLQKANEAKLQGLARVAEEERDELYRLQQAGQLNKTTAALVEQIYDAKRLTVYNDLMEKLGHEIDSSAKEWQRLGLESHKAIDDLFKKEIEAGTKTLDEHAKAVAKITEEYGKLTQQAGSQSLQHQLSMVTAGGDHGNQLGALQKQQAIERQDIEDRYRNSLDLAKHTLSGSELMLQKANLDKERGIELSRLDNELEEKTAELRQKGVHDFFQDMQGQAQTAGNILYESMHQGLDRVSDEFAKLVTLQKTNFGKMFEQLGQEMVRNSFRSLLQRGIGALAGHHAGAAPPIVAATAKVQAGVVYVTGPVASSGLAAGAAIGGGASALGSTLGKAAGGIGGFLKSLFGGGGGGTPDVTSTFIPALAGGGDVDPGHAYWVGDGGEPELFSPKSSGTITPMSKMGGDSFAYHIDARGSSLGVEHRVAQAIEMSHKASVARAVQASAERGKRIPRSSR